MGEDKCELFECFEPLRWSGFGEDCVADECQHDSLFISPDEDYSCLKRCKCLTGEACKLSKECDPSTFQCLYPYVLNDFTKTCHIEGCALGTIKEDKHIHIENGRCFMDCSCKDNMEEAKETCSYDSRPDCSHISCDTGYTFDKANTHDSAHVKKVGGKCVKAHKGGGTSAGVTTFVSIFMLVIGIAA